MKAFVLLLLFTSLAASSVCQLINNYDTCRTQVYYQSTGNANSETHIAKARTVQGNGIIQAGYIKQGGGQDAVLIKQDLNGQVLWQKEFGNTLFDEQFTDWTELKNRQLLLGGIAKNRSTLQTVFFMMLLTADGDIVWQKSFVNSTATSNITNAKISQNYGGEIFFTVKTDSSLTYGLTSSTGLLNWQRSIRSTPDAELVAAVAHYSNFLIATNALDSGYHTAKFYSIPYYWTGQPKEVKFTTRIGGPHQNSHYRLHDFEQIGQYSYFSGVRSENNAPYEVTRICFNQARSIIGLETISTPGVAIDAVSRTAIDSYGNAICFTAGNKNNKINAVQLTGSYEVSTLAIWSATYVLPDSIIIQGSTKTWDNGYVFWGFKETGSTAKKIIQLKTDSSSAGPACIDREPRQFSVNRNALPQDTVTYTYNNQFLLADPAFAASVSPGIIDTSILCKELKCPQLPLSDSCSESYQKLYKSYGPFSYSMGIQVISNRVFIIGREMPMNYFPESTTIFVAEIGRNGQVVNQRRFPVGNINYARIHKGRDSSLIVYGFTEDTLSRRSVMIAKLDTNLNVTWIKTMAPYNNSTLTTGFNTGEICEATDGSIFLQYGDGIVWGPTRLFLTKLDANGNFLWTKIYRASYPGAGLVNLIAGYRLEISGGYVYYMAKNAYNDYSSGILLKLAENNGNLQWCKKISIPGGYIDLTRLIFAYNNELVLGGITRDGNGGDSRNILLKVSTDGSITSTASFSNPLTNAAPPMQFIHDNNGTIYGNGSYYNTPPASNPSQFNIKFSNNLDIVSARKRTSVQAAFLSEINPLALGTGGQLYETGSYGIGYNSISLIYVIKFAADGRVGSCPMDTMLLQKTGTPSITVTDITCIQSDSSFTIQTPQYRSEQFYLATTKLVCASVPGCNAIDVTGNTSVCDLSVPYTFRAVRNNGCAAPLQWLYDNSNIQVLAETDSTIIIRFLTAGDLLLRARFSSGCTEYSDSLLIHINGTVPVLNLGKDTILCNGAGLLLNAKKGFLSYKWQDGSTDSVFLATQAGLYFVSVTDSCGKISADSITIFPDNTPNIDLGTNVSICRTDSARIQATAGFSNYNWTPSINILTQGNMATVFPAASTRYYVSALKQNGCLTMDSVLITVNTPAAVSLGPDKSVCRGDTVQLNAGNGFIQYNWSTGEQTPSIKVYSSGLYFIAATDINGCVARDSFSLLQLFALPVTQLPKEAAICRGQSVTLHAGTGFNNYLWNTGAATENIQVFTTGLYWVQVTNSSGCKKTDTINIDRLLDIPSDFIKIKDSTICSYESLTLTAPDSFSSYLWSNGTVIKTATFADAGTCWLKVTDNNGCTGVDSFALFKKICNKGLFFPNSFTPNADGLNDVYKPRAYGKLVLYQFAVYNRYGEKIFETNNITEGWNGEYKNMKQETGGFIWLCKYQLEGDTIQSKKGTFTLIR